MKKTFLNYLMLLILICFNFSKQTYSQGSSASIFVYHRFGENKYPSTNVKIKQFEAHINEILNNNYNVLPIDKIIDHLVNGKELPPKTIGITIDDAFKSIYKKAWPRLKAAGLPFTVFVSTGPIDANSKNYMNWNEIKNLRDSGVLIGHHTVRHMHLVNQDDETIDGEIENASNSFKKNLGYVPNIFSYPYGEYSLKIKNLIKEKKFKAAFGQHSGVLFDGIDIFELPRFGMNETYGNIDRFKFAANAHGLKVKEITPKDIVIKNINPPLMGFTLIDEIEGNLRCYPSHNIKANLQKLGKVRYEIRFDQEFPKGRTRVNCTINDKGKWRWYGIQFYRP